MPCFDRYLKSGSEADMIRSMTGYGRREAVRGSFRLTVEMRAVNHRFCEVVVRLPKSWGMLEDRVKKIVTSHVQRGRVDVTIAIERDTTATGGFSVDWDKAEHYLQAARQMNDHFSLTGMLTAKDLLAMPGVVQVEEAAQVAVEEMEEWLAATVEEAVQDLFSMKQAEGKKLLEDLSQRLTQVKEWAAQVNELAPLAVEEYRKRLQQRMAEWAEEVSAALDHQRITQEIVLYADRSDISEETTRLTSHCTQFSEQLTKAEAVGRKLDFLLQEMNREANTIAAKANYLPIQRLAVEIKTELEKMREQVQNIE